MAQHEAFTVLMECLSSGNKEAQDKIEQYVVHRKMFGRMAAKHKYPEVHYIQISDPTLEKIWKDLLKTVDKL